MKSSNPLVSGPPMDLELSHEQVLELLRNNDSCLRRLNLGSESDTPQHIDAIITAMQGNTAVQQLNLSIDRMKPAQLDLLIPALPFHVNVSTKNIKALDQFFERLLQYKQCGLAEKATADSKSTISTDHKSVRSLGIAWSDKTNTMEGQDDEGLPFLCEYLKASSLSSACMMDSLDFNWTVSTTILKAVADSSIVSLSIYSNLSERTTRVKQPSNSQRKDPFLCTTVSQMMMEDDNLISSKNHNVSLTFLTVTVSKCRDLVQALRELRIPSRQLLSLDLTLDLKALDKRLPFHRHLLYWRWCFGGEVLFDEDEADVEIDEAKDEGNEEAEKDVNYLGEKEDEEVNEEIEVDKEEEIDDDSEEEMDADNEEEDEEEEEETDEEDEEEEYQEEEDSNAGDELIDEYHHHWHEASWFFARLFLWYPNLQRLAIRVTRNTTAVSLQAMQITVQPQPSVPSARSIILGILGLVETLQVLTLEFDYRHNNHISYFDPFRHTRLQLKQLQPVFHRLNRLSLHISPQNLIPSDCLFKCTNLEHLTLVFCNHECRQCCYDAIGFLRISLPTLTGLKELLLLHDLGSGRESDSLIYSKINDRCSKEFVVTLHNAVLNHLLNLESIVWNHKMYEFDEYYDSDDAESDNSYSDDDESDGDEDDNNFDSKKEYNRLVTEIYDCCQMRSIKILDLPLNLVPLAVHKLCCNRWINVVYHLIQERDDVLVLLPQQQIISSNEE